MQSVSQSHSHAMNAYCVAGTFWRANFHDHSSMKIFHRLNFGNHCRVSLRDICEVVQCSYGHTLWQQGLVSQAKDCGLAWLVQSNYPQS